MNIKQISYHKVFNLGNYSNEKIGVEIEINEGDDPITAHAEAVKYVERAHEFQKQYPNYERAKTIAANPDNYTGYQVKEAKTAVELFETNFAEHLTKFFPTVNALPTATQQEEITNW